MTDSLPTLEECEAALILSFGPDEGALAWVGRCYEIAAKLLEQSDTENSILQDRFPEGTRLCYGHYLGERSPDGLYPYNPNLPFEQHGWLELPDGRIFDPTGWAFASSTPELYIGPADDYDEGGNKYRSATLQPAPEWDKDAEIVQLQLTRNLCTWIQAEYGTPEPDGRLTTPQVFHLANRHPDEMPDVVTIYEAIIETEHGKAAIPLDNQLKYLEA